MRGRYRITDAGRKLLADHPDGITEKDLRAFLGAPDAPHTYHALKALEETADDEPGDAVPEKTVELDPIEQVGLGIKRINSAVAAELLTRLHAGEPVFFEQAVLDLIMAMGYGGAEGTATRTQLSNDGGIDGIVDQDALGLSRIYVQAKRYALDASVGRPEIQAFVGALHGNQANQGVFITTGRFSSGARALHRLRAHSRRAHRRHPHGLAHDPIRRRRAGQADSAHRRGGRGLLRVAEVSLNAVGGVAAGTIHSIVMIPTTVGSLPLIVMRADKSHSSQEPAKPRSLTAPTLRFQPGTMTTTTPKFTLIHCALS